MASYTAHNDVIYLVRAHIKVCEIRAFTHFLGVGDIIVRTAILSGKKNDLESVSQAVLS